MIFPNIKQSRNILQICFWKNFGFVQLQKCPAHRLNKLDNFWLQPKVRRKLPLFSPNPFVFKTLVRSCRNLPEPLPAPKTFSRNGGGRGRKGSTLGCHRDLPPGTPLGTPSKASAAHSPAPSRGSCLHRVKLKGREALSSGTTDGSFQGWNC